MPVLIFLLYNIVGSVGAQGAVNILIGVFRSVADVEGRAVGGTRLIPDTENARIAGGRAESLQRIVDARIQKAENDALAPVAERGLRLHAQDTGHLQAGGVQRGEKLWCQGVIDALRQTAGDIAQVDHAEARAKELRAEMRIGVQKILVGNGDGQDRVKIIIRIYFILQGRLRHRLSPSYLLSI